jgi:hypothetical protein
MTRADGRITLLYLDGDEEWADLSRENLVWLRATRHGALSAGIVTGRQSSVAHFCSV